MVDDEKVNAATIIMVIQGLIQIVFSLMEIAGLSENQKAAMYIEEKEKFESRPPGDLVDYGEEG